MKTAIQRKARGGFTLIELLVVMVILAILAAIAIPKFTKTREQAYRNTMVADLKNISSQQEIYQISNMTYASDLDDLGASPSRDVTIDITEATGNGWAATAVHGGLAGSQCGVYYGTAAPSNGAPALSPGVITCDVVP